MERRPGMASKGKTVWMLLFFGFAWELCPSLSSHPGNSWAGNRGIRHVPHGQNSGRAEHAPADRESTNNTPVVPIHRVDKPGWILVPGWRMGRSWRESADFAETVATFEAAAPVNPDWKIRANGFSGLFSACPDIMAGYQFSGGLRLGIQTGYRHHFSGILELEQSFDGAAASFSQTQRFGLDARSVPVSLVLAHPFPAFSRIRIRAAMGLDLYRASVTFHYRFENAGGSAWRAGDLKDSGTGFHLYAGFEYLLGNRIYWTLEAGYAWGILGAFSGWAEDSDGARTDVRLVMEETGSGRKLSLVPAGNLKWLKNAEADLGGFTVMAGLRWEAFGIFRSE